MRLQVLILIILLGGVLRFTYINWDSFQSFHPDERNISWAVTRIRFFSQMNPQFFAYGGLPVYLYRAIGEVIVRVSHNPDWLFDWGHIAVIGRYISATLSTISILLIYFVGSLYFSRPAGLASAAFLAFSPWAIREAHFSTTETMLVFFLLLLLLFAKKITMERVLILGVVWGVALGAKTTSLLFGIIPLAAIWIPDFLKKFSRKFLFTVLLFAAAGLFFFLFSPYTILDFGHFRESMTYETGVALGRLSVPYHALASRSLSHRRTPRTYPPCAAKKIYCFSSFSPSVFHLGRLVVCKVFPLQRPAVAIHHSRRRLAFCCVDKAFSRCRSYFYCSITFHYVFMGHGKLARIYAPANQNRGHQMDL